VYAQQLKHSISSVTVILLDVKKYLSVVFLVCIFSEY